jgi:DtxR family Mn-dependent transcriptional regulator
METTVSKEDYLKAISEAASEGEPVIAATLVRWLQVTPAAVTMALRRLKKDGLVSVTNGGQVDLTRSGAEIASRIRFRHHLIERMLAEMFGMPWYKVHDEAERLEHAVSSDFETLLVEKLGSAGVCPHGNNIQGDGPAERRSRGLQPLTDLSPGATGRVMCVFERDRTLLEYLDGLGVRPGASIRMLNQNPDATFSVGVAKQTCQLGAHAAERIWIGADGTAGDE